MKKPLFIGAAALACVLLSGCDHDLNAYDEHYASAFLIIVLIVSLSFVLGKYTNMLRDEISNRAEFNDNLKKLKRLQHVPLLNRNSPYSLAKAQFAGWTVVIASSYIYLSLCKGDCATAGINKTALVLMGIGAGIVTATTIMDKREMLDNRPRHQNRPSRGFFVDILSDENGISIHRFQNFVWTVIAMIVYTMKVAHVQNGCVLPELSDTLLALTGISGVTFLTLRATENKPVAEGSAKGTTPIDDMDTAETV